MKVEEEKFDRKKEETIVKKKVVFGVGVMTLVVVGATGLVVSMKQERDKEHKATYAMEKSVVPVVTDDAQATGQTSKKDYGKVVTYEEKDCKEQVEKYVKLLKENSDIEGMSPDQVQVEIPMVYEYRNHKVYFVCKDDGGAIDYQTPDAADVEAEEIVKSSMDLILDGLKIDVTEDTFISVYIVQFRSEEEKGKMERIYNVEVQTEEDIYSDQNTCAIAYDAISGKMLKFSQNINASLSDEMEENQSKLTKWPNTGKAAEGKYGDRYGRVENAEDKKILEEYIEKINALLTDGYGLPSIKEIKLGYVEYNRLHLYYETESGGFTSIVYNLNDEYIEMYFTNPDKSFDEQLLNEIFLTY